MLLPMHYLLDGIRAMRSNGKTLTDVLHEIHDGFHHGMPWIRHVGSERRVCAAAVYVFTRDLA